MKSTAENLLLWEQRIKEKVHTGITVEEWCKKNGVSKHQYNYWNHRVRQKQKPEEEVPFADITSILSNTATAEKESVSSTDFQIIFQDIRIIVPRDFHPEALAGLMKVLRAV